MNKKNRRTHLQSLAAEERTMIFYEAPHKLSATLVDLQDAFGADRRISLCRELTKLHEEVRRTTLGEAVDYYRANPPKGEFVLVVEGAPHQAPEQMTLEAGVERMVQLMEAEKLSRKEAAKRVAAETGLGKNELYQKSLVN